MLDYSLAHIMVKLFDLFMNVPKKASLDHQPINMIVYTRTLERYIGIGEIGIIYWVSTFLLWNPRRDSLIVSQVALREFIMPSLVTYEILLLLLNVFTLPAVVM